MKRKIFYILCIALTTLLIFVACVAYISFKYSIFFFEGPLEEKPQLWSHRGIGNNYAENSIEAFEKAIMKEAKGIEIDVYYQQDKKEISVTHDLPKEDTVYLELDQILSRFKDSIFYWIDFKNLDKNNADEVASKLSDLSLKLNLREKLFVESVEAAPLNVIKSNGIKTLYWLQYDRTNPIKKYLKKIYIKTILLTYKFDGISTASQFYDSDFKESFSPIPTFIFHPEDRRKIEALKKDPNVNVILTDWEYKN